MNTITIYVKRFPLLTWFGLSNLIAAFIVLLLTQFDDRLLNGISVWIKPAKFHMTAAIYMWSMALFLSLLPDIRKADKIARLITLFMFIEVVLIDVQAASGVASHFNISTPWNMMVYSIMGIVIMANTIVAAYTAWLFFRQPVQLDKTMLWAVRLGIIVFVLGSLQGGVMSAINQHSVGTADHATGIFFLNWNKEGGDLRIAHFVGVHALQIIPLFAWLMRKLRLQSVPMVIAFSLLYFIAFTGVMVHALLGRPLF